MIKLWPIYYFQQVMTNLLFMKICVAYTEKISQKLHLDIVMHLWKFHQNLLRNEWVMTNLLFLKICVAETAEIFQKLHLDILMHLWKFHQDPLKNKWVMANLLFMKICVAYTDENVSKVAFRHSNPSVKISSKFIEK